MKVINDCFCNQNINIFNKAHDWIKDHPTVKKILIISAVILAVAIPSYYSCFFSLNNIITKDIFVKGIPLVLTTLFTYFTTSKLISVFVNKKSKIDTHQSAEKRPEIIPPDRDKHRNITRCDKSRKPISGSKIYEVDYTKDDKALVRGDNNILMAALIMRVLDYKMPPKFSLLDEVQQIDNIQEALDSVINRRNLLQVKVETIGSGNFENELKTLIEQNGSVCVLAKKSKMFDEDFIIVDRIEEDGLVFRSSRFGCAYKAPIGFFNYRNTGSNVFHVNKIL